MDAVCVFTGLSSSLSDIIGMKLIRSRSADVIVIGSDLAGLVVASELQQSGACVQVFDKSGDLGGRLALRRRSEERWNHGAPCVEAASEAFHNLLESLCEAGSATLTGEPSSALTRYSGAPDLRAAVNLGMGSAGGTRCFGLAEGWFVEPDAQGAFASAQTLVETMTGSWMSADVAASAQ